MYRRSLEELIEYSRIHGVGGSLDTVRRLNLNPADPSRPRTLEELLDYSRIHGVGGPLDSITRLNLSPTGPSNPYPQDPRARSLDELIEDSRERSFLNPRYF